MPRINDLFNELHANLGRLADDLASYESSFSARDVDRVIEVRKAIDAAHHDFHEACSRLTT